MKPPPFGYSRPATVDEAVADLSRIEGAKVLAGGQSLVPLLTMRLAAPPHLVDINRVAGLDGVEVVDAGDGDGGGRAVRIGAAARHADVEAHAGASDVVPLLGQALCWVAHPTIRNRGTTVGSVVHADPSGEMTAVLALLGGSVQVRGTGGVRDVAADDFFLGPLESAVGPGELATSITVPEPEGRTGSAWLELSRRHGDYAMAGVGVLVRLDEDARVASLRVGLISVGPTPVVLDLTDAVGGAAADAADWAAAGRLAAGQVDPEPDLHATADYRRHLVAVLTARAAASAGADALDRAAVPAGAAA